MRAAWATVAIVIAATALVASMPLAQSSARGSWDARDRGCYCHSASPSPNVGFTVLGLPGQYMPGMTYTVEIKVTLTDVGVVANKSQGGFYLEASAGNLSVPAGWEGLVQVEGNASTHTLNGSRMRTWLVNWTAPQEAGLVVWFLVYVNTVNGNGSETFGTDHWTQRTVRIGVGAEPEVTGPPPVTPPFAMETYGLLAFALVAAGVSLALFWSARKKPEAGAIPPVETENGKLR
jgi:hypothetical protein